MPLGAAAHEVLLSEHEILQAALQLLGAVSSGPRRARCAHPRALRTKPRVLS